MSSVSLTVPFIPDFVTFKKRGLAYGYMGFLFALATISVITILDFDVDKKIDQEYFFIFTSSFGIICALIFCSFFKDK